MHRGPRMPSALSWGILAALVLAACSSTLRLKNDFSSEIPEAVPVAAPPPSPPADSFLWSRAASAARIAPRPGGGNWVVIVPTPLYYRDPKGANSASLLIADSETFTPSPGEIRGEVSLSFVGLGRVLFWLEALAPNGTVLGPLGGFDILNVTTQTSVGSLSGPNIQTRTGRTSFGSYPRGGVVRVAWSIDPVAKSFSVTATNGSPHHSPFSVPTPIPRVRLTVILENAGTGQVQLFLDDFSMDET